MRHYTSYNLHIASQLELPELLPAKASGSSVDVEIAFGDVATEGKGQKNTLGSNYFWADPNEFWLQVPEIGRFLVQYGKLITINPEPGVDEFSLRLYLLGSGFGALLYQRGYLVLHGNAVRIGDQCMVCVGPSGAGKSTLAAAFQQRGYPILADDVVPVDDKFRAIPGYPRVKLCQDSADRISIDTSGLRRIHPDMEKYNYPLTDGFCTEPLPIRWIYLLDSHHETTFRLEPIHGAERFAPLFRNTYRVSFLECMGLKPAHMKQSGQLAGQIHLRRITRPKHGFELEPLVERILMDIEQNP